WDDSGVCDWSAGIGQMRSLQSVSGQATIALSSMSMAAPNCGHSAALQLASMCPPVEMATPPTPAQTAYLSAPLFSDGAAEAEDDAAPPPGLAVAVCQRAARKVDSPCIAGDLSQTMRGKSNAGIRLEQMALEEVRRQRVGAQQVDALGEAVALVGEDDIRDLATGAA